MTTFLRSKLSVIASFAVLHPWKEICPKFILRDADPSKFIVTVHNKNIKNTYTLFINIKSRNENTVCFFKRSLTK